MASSARQIQKALAGKEDLLLGDGTVTQTRNGASYSITKLNADEIPYSGDAVSADVVTIKEQIDSNTNITAKKTVDTIADLIAVTSTERAIALYVNVAGFYSAGDGGGGLFKWNSAGLESTHNGGTIISPYRSGTPGDATWWTVPTTGNDGVWDRVESRVVNVMVFGGLTGLVAGIGSTEITGIITDTQTLTADLTTPSTMFLNIRQGGKIAGAYTLTVNGNIVAGECNIFDSALTVDFSDCLNIFISAIWFGDSDTGAKINSAITALGSSNTRRIEISTSIWAGVTYNTSIVLNTSAHLVFPSAKDTPAVYSGSVAALQLTTNRSRVSNFGVSLSGNLNSNVDGIFLYQASDAIFDGGVNIFAAVRDGIRFDGDGVGAYNNTFYGITRVTNSGANCITFTNSDTSNHPNANTFYHCVLNGATDYGVEFDWGYGNHIHDCYIQAMSAPGWAIYAHRFTNKVGHLTIDNSTTNGIKIDNAAYLHIDYVQNAASGTTTQETEGGQLRYIDRYDLAFKTQNLINVQDKNVLAYTESASATKILDASAIRDIFAGGGTIIIIMSSYSAGASNLGYLYKKGNDVIQLANVSGSSCKLIISMDFDTTNGTWRTALEDIDFYKPLSLCISYDSDSVASNPELFINKQYSILSETSTPEGSKVSNSGDDMLIGNNAFTGGTRNLDGSIRRIIIFDSELTIDKQRDYSDPQKAFDPSEWTNDGVVALYDNSNITPTQWQEPVSKNDGLHNDVVFYPEKQISEYADRYLNYADDDAEIYIPDGVAELEIYINVVTEQAGTTLRIGTSAEGQEVVADVATTSTGLSKLTVLITEFLSADTLYLADSGGSAWSTLDFDLYVSYKYIKGIR